MKTKNIGNRKILIFLMGIIFLGGFLIAAQREGSSAGEDKKNISEEFGKNLDKFFNSGEREKETIIKNEKYRQIFLESLKISNNLDKLVERWFEIDDKGEQKLGDDVRSILFRELVRTDPSIAKKIADGALKKLRISNPNYYFENLDSFIIEESLLDRLVWKGDKLGIMNNGELELWVDFKDLPDFLTKIEFKNEGGILRLYLSYNGEENSQIVGLNAGSLNYRKDYIAPDGRVFGRTYNGIKSINYDSNTETLKIGYYDFDGNIQTLEINPKNLFGKSTGTSGANLGSIIDILSDENFLSFYNARTGRNFNIEQLRKLSRDIEELKNTDEEWAGEESDRLAKLREEAKKLLEEFGKRVSNIDIPDANILNLGFVRKGETGPAEILVDYNKEDGTVELTIKGRALAVSTNVEGKAGIVLGVNPGSKGETKVKYDKRGVVEGHKFAEQIIFNRNGVEEISIYSDEDFIGTRVVRSSLAEFARGGQLRIPSALRELMGTALSEKVGLAVGGEASIQEVAEAISGLKSVIDNKNLDYELKRQAQDILDAANEELVKVFQESFNSLLSDLPDDLRKRTESVLEGRFGELMMGRAEEQAKQAMRSLTSPENIETLRKWIQNPEDNSDAFDGMISSALKDYISGYESLFARNALPDRIADRLSEITGENVDVSEVNQAINNWVSSEEFSRLIREEKSKNTGDAVRNRLERILIELEVNPENANDLISEYDKIMEEIEAQLTTQYETQKKAFIDGFRGRIATMYDSEYKTNILYDSESGELIYVGENKARVDVKEPLRKVSVEHKNKNKDSAFALTSYGKDIARFYGENTDIKRRAGDGKVAPILEIENTKKPDERLMVLSKGYEYHILDPLKEEDLKTIFRHYGTFTITTRLRLIGNIDILTHTANMIRNKYVQDVGTDKDASINLRIEGESLYTGLFSKLIRNAVREAALKEIPKQVGSELEKARKRVDEEIKKHIDGQEGLRDLITKGVQTGQDLLTMAESLGVRDIPNEQEIRDLLEVGRMIGETGNAGLRTQMAYFFEWLTSPSVRGQLRPGAIVKIKNDRVIVGNQEYIGFNPALLRQALREAAYNNELIPGHISVGHKRLMELIMEKLRSR